MEPIITKRIITYNCLYPTGNDNLEELLKVIPSASAIEQASYILVQKTALTIDKDEHSLFFQMFPFMDSSLV